MYYLISIVKVNCIIVLCSNCSNWFIACTLCYHSCTYRQFGQSHVTYQGNRTAPTVEQDDASNLGEELRLAVTINNEGPSTIHNAALTLYIPARTTRDNDNNYYFYYPAAMVIN